MAIRYYDPDDEGSEEGPDSNVGHRMVNRMGSLDNEQGCSVAQAVVAADVMTMMMVMVAVAS